jgi:catechol 2,3-dioxygenase-like lactoylglutathione lyase family enzyme
MRPALHHVSLGSNNMHRALKFYDAVLATLGFKRVMDFEPFAVGYGDQLPEFWIQEPFDKKAASVGNGVHIAFIATSKAQVHAFYETAIAHGGKDDGVPGPRPDYGEDYYGCYVRDPDGNKIEAALLMQPVVYANPEVLEAAVHHTPLPVAKPEVKRKVKTKPKAKPAKAKPVTTAKKASVKKTAKNSPAKTARKKR